MRIAGRIVSIVFVALVIIACAPALEPSPPPTTPIALPSPIREARTVPQPDGSIRIEAVSARVAPGQPYLYPVFTHCGFTDNSFDFDGSFWTIADAPAAFAVRNGNPPAGIGNPTDRGVMILVAADRAVWTSERGIRLELARAGGDVRTFGCD